MKRTTLYDEHVKHGARMVDFAGWEMPIQYLTGINQEHLAVRESVGLFDVSHMGEVRITGEEATDFLSYATLNNPAKLRPGRAQYSMLPNDQGGLIDDLYIYCEGESEYLVVCNASNVDEVVPHLEQLAGDYNVKVHNESERWGLMALQGPGAALLMSRLTDEDITSFKKNRTLKTTLVGREVMLARTGYTGEDGFEIFCEAQDAPQVWRTLTDAGATPCGLGARDTLRLEAGFPLFGHEFTGSTNPLCSSYAWVVKDKPFYGREAMWDPDCKRQLVGLRLLQRGVARQGYHVLHEGEIVGEVTSGTISPLTREGIAVAWVDAEHCELGTTLAVEVRGQGVDATVVKPAFYP